MDYSISPDGEKFKLPDEEDYRQEYEKLLKLVDWHREQGCEVKGLGRGHINRIKDKVRKRKLTQ